MNTVQVTEAIRSFDSERVYKGTFAVNQIPLVYTREAPFAFVVNTDPIPGAGLHWVAIYCPERGKPCEYFDTAGLPPLHDNLIRVLSSQSDEYDSVSQPLQSPCSDVCGEFCIAYLFCRIAAGITFDEFLSFFLTDRVSYNDRRVYDFVHSYFPIVSDTLSPPPASCSVQFSRS